MKCFARVMVALLLAAAASVGGVKGEWSKCYSYDVDPETFYLYQTLPGTGNTCRIRAYGPTTYTGKLMIPAYVKVPMGSSFKFLTVVEIADSAFAGCYPLTKVHLSSRMRKIGEDAFRGCSGLVSIEVDEYNENFCAKNGVLFTVNKDTLIYYPEGKPEGLYIIPSGVRAIANGAFAGCKNLANVDIPSGVKTIEGGAFSGCSGLQSIEVESGNKNYCAENGVLFTKNKDTLICYPGGKAEESYIIPDGVTAIGRSAFKDCSNLKALTIPGSLTKIGERAFYGCGKLETVDIKDGVKEIGSFAFTGCANMTAVTIPGSVTKIGAGAFLNCRKLSKVVLNDGTMEIGDSVFYSCSGLLEVTIPGSVTAIGKSAFRECSELPSVTIPGSVTKIGERAFYGCKKLGTVDIKDGVKEIGKSAFRECSELPSVTIPGSVTEIEESAFFNCRKLSKVVLNDGTIEIWDSVFYSCSGLPEVTIPGSVAAIGRSAFQDCSNLETVDIKDGVKRIWNYAFSGCAKMKAVTIPSSVLTIWIRAFSGCSELTAVTIPSSVKEIGRWAFLGCSGLKSIEVESGNKKYCAAGGVLFTKDKATLVCYPGGKPEESYTIPSSVTEIGEAAFFGCTGLTAVTIPSSVKEIGSWAFRKCSELNAVYWLAGDLWSPGLRLSFKGIASPATLYVRQGEKAAIEKKEWAKKYFSEVVEGYVVTFKDGEGNKLGEQLVEPNGRATVLKAPAKEGYPIVEWQLNGVKYKFSTKVTQDITLVAVWKKKEESTPDNPETAVESVQLAAVRAVRNPVGEALELEGMERAARVEVYSVVGARVHAEALRGEPRVVIDAQGWASGVYVVRVEASDGAKTLRVVK